MSNPNNSLSLAGAGALSGAAALAGAGALAGSGALAAAVGLNVNENENGNGNGNGNGNLNGNGNGNFNGNASFNDTLNDNVNANVNVNQVTTNVTTTVAVNLGLEGEVDLGPPNMTIEDSIFIPDPGSGDIAVANNGSSAAIYNGDVFNFGKESGTQSVFDLDQANSLADVDVAYGISAGSTDSNFVLSAGCLEAGEVSVSDGIGKADNIAHATNSVAASADAAVNFSAFEQSITQGANIQYNSATQTVIGGSETNFGDTFGDVS